MLATPYIFRTGSVARTVALLVVAASAFAALLLAPTPASAQTPPNVPAPSTLTPSAATQAVIADAQAKVKVGQYAKAVAALMAAQTPTLSDVDKQALDFALADTQQMWGISLIQSNQSGVNPIRGSQNDEALHHLEASLKINSSSSTRLTQQEIDLQLIGFIYVAIDQNEQAVRFFLKALPICRETKDRSGEAAVLMSLGIAYSQLSRGAQAIESYQQALIICRDIKDRDEEAKILMNMGIAYVSLSRYEKAIELYQQAMPIYQEIKYRHGEASTLSNVGNAYHDLGQDEKAIDFHQKALLIYQEVKDREGEADTLTNLGSAYLNLSRYKKAIEFYQQVLPIYREVKDRGGEATALNGIGIAYHSLSQNEKALKLHQQSLLLFQQIGDKEGEAKALGGLGNTYTNLRQYQMAIDYFQQVLPIYRVAGDREGEAATLDQLSYAWSHPDNPHRLASVAIFLGKQAINVYQSIRADIKGLDKQTQKGYADSVSDTYRRLADLLIAEGRLPEAQQVLNLLKEQEFFDFVRRDAAEASGLGKADLNVLEKQASDSIQAESDKVTEAGTRYAALLEAEKTETDAAKKAALDKQLDAADKARTAANTAFQKVLDNLASLFAAHSGAVAQKSLNVGDTEALTGALGTLDAQTHRRTVAIYTLVGEKTLRFLVYTGSGAAVAREYPIGAADLNRKVAAFRDALQNPRVDPRPLGKQIYDILIGPVKGDIAGAQSVTQAGALAGEVMWSLDGTLRYLPLAALSPDGVHYLIEQNVDQSIFTPATVIAGHLTDATKPDWSVLAVGVTGARTEGTDSFSALPGVASELNGIVQSGGSGASGGIFPGTGLLDAAFTQEALVRALRPRAFPLVHVASHFRFRPGDEGNSYLLLGVGKLTLADVKALPADLFRGVDLLTLSACDTAMGGGAAGGAKVDDANSAGDGSEVESFGVLVQKKGAEAVLATLWSVADASTPALMQQFYRLRQAHPELPKAEALRQAQIALLIGGTKPSAETGTAGRGELDNPPATADTPMFKPDPAKPWAHPYYWAPFILIGNWK